MDSLNPERKIAAVSMKSHITRHVNDSNVTNTVNHLQWKRRKHSATSTTTIWDLHILFPILFPLLPLLLSYFSSCGCYHVNAYVLPVPLQHQIFQRQSSLYAIIPKTTQQQQQQNKLNEENEYGNQRNNDQSNQRMNENSKIPFLIEALPINPPPRVYKEISEMCIDAFFNDNSRNTNNPVVKGIFTTTTTTTTTIAPWKEYQLAYLRTLQQGDLAQRRRQQSETNFMLVARTIVPVQQQEQQVQSNAPLLLDYENVYNFHGNIQQEDYVRGEVIGFVEVTQKQYGIGPYETKKNQQTQESSSSSSNTLWSFLSSSKSNQNSNTMNTMEDTTDTSSSSSSSSSVRPFLTNLSVKSAARRSGVGSALAQRCEEEVMTRWKKNEIILEVEEDNTLALEFYRKRGYQVLFEDKTGRRYDTTGLWLQQKRCKRYVMRKIIEPNINQATEEVKSALDKGLQAFFNLKQSFFASKETD